MKMNPAVIAERRGARADDTSNRHKMLVLHALAHAEHANHRRRRCPRRGGAAAEPDRRRRRGGVDTEVKPGYRHAVARRHGRVGLSNEAHHRRCKAAHCGGDR